MARFPVGPSSYGDLRGVMQYVNSLRIAMQFLSLKIDFDRLPSSRATGARLTVNEGMRSRARQSWLYAMRFVLGIVVAVPFTSRHDEVTRGNAMDLGVTMPDGSNRALTPAEFAWMHQQCELRGFTWTGRNFGEPWHIEGATRPEHFPPYPFATVDMAFGPIDPTPAPTPAPAPEPEPPYLPKEYDVIFIRSQKSNTPYLLTDVDVEDLDEATARAYADAVPHEDGTSLFVPVSSGKAQILIKATRDRRKRRGLAITSAIEKALAAEKE